MVGLGRLLMPLSNYIYVPRNNYVGKIFHCFPHTSEWFPVEKKSPPYFIIIYLKRTAHLMIKASVPCTILNIFSYIQKLNDKNVKYV